MAVVLICVVCLLTRNTGELLPLAISVEVVLALACFGRALTGHGGRRASLALGAGLLAWALGGIVWALESPPSIPSVADVFSLAFYPLAGVALLLLVGPELRQGKASVWLNAAVAALGTAAICSAFASDTVGRLGGSSASVAVGLAYPIGDIALLALALGIAVVGAESCGADHAVRLRERTHGPRGHCVFAPALPWRASVRSSARPHLAGSHDRNDRLAVASLPRTANGHHVSKRRWGWPSSLSCSWPAR